MCHDTYPPNKRRRTEGIYKEPKKIVYILRGVPGTGKTTLADKIEKSYELSGWDIFKINRDEVRENLIKSNRFKEIFGKELGYQESFSNVTANTLIRDKYYALLSQKLTFFKWGSRKSVLIIDSTHTKIADLIHTLDIFKTDESYDRSFRNLNIFIVTKRTIHGNTHNVPENVMKGFQRELKESDEWLNKKFPKKEKVTLL